MHNLSLSLKYFWIFKVTQIQNVFEETSHINNHQGKTIFLKPETISLKVTSLSKMYLAANSLIKVPRQVNAFSFP